MRELKHQSNEQAELTTKSGEESLEDDSIEKDILSTNQQQNKLGLSVLPSEVVEKIFTYLDPSSIKAVACVSRYV